MSSVDKIVTGFGIAPILKDGKITGIVYNNILVPSGTGLRPYTLMNKASGAASLSQTFAGPNQFAKGLPTADAKQEAYETLVEKLGPGMLAQILKKGTAEGFVKESLEYFSSYGRTQKDLSQQTLAELWNATDLKTATERPDEAWRAVQAHIKKAEDMLPLMKAVNKDSFFESYFAQAQSASVNPKTMKVSSRKVKV